MLVLSCSDLSRGFDRDPLFVGLGFELHQGERVGLVGPNGVGKSTLMKILAGQDRPDVGSVRLHGGATVGILDQHAEFPVGRTLYAETRSAFDHLIQLQEELVSVAEKMAVATDAVEQKVLSDRYDRLNERLSHQDAYALDHKVDEVLGGLGFAEGDFHRDINTFSGGQQRRALLAKLLLASPDVMLLDEPSNHLDIATVSWLEGYLMQQNGAMIIVSHDRYFLNRVVNKIFEMHRGKIEPYPGNFQQYIRLREERYALQLKEFEAQKEYIDKQEEYIKRVGYGQLAKQAQSRTRTLEKLERLEKPTRVESPHMNFGPVMRTGDIVFAVEDLSKSYGSLQLFRDVSFGLQRGKRLGLLGPNGCGKTTLLRILLGEEKPTSGYVQRGQLVEVGYLDQHLELLDENKSILQAVWPEPDPDLNEKKMRDMLARFGLTGDILEQKIGACSGGERSRAALARLVMQGVNVLILDEPTNHLDIWACESLERALMAYEGTVIVVSHDRYLLNRVVDMLVVMENGKSEVVYGNYDVYQLLVANRQAAAKEEAARKAKNNPQSPAKAAPVNVGGKPTKRKRKFPYRKVEDLEAEIAGEEARVADLEAMLASGEIYRDASKFNETMKAFDTSKANVARLYEHWEEASELN